MLRFNIHKDQTCGLLERKLITIDRCLLEGFEPSQEAFRIHGCNEPSIQLQMKNNTAHQNDIMCIRNDQRRLLSNIMISFEMINLIELRCYAKGSWIATGKHSVSVKMIKESNFFKQFNT